MKKTVFVVIDTIAMGPLEIETDSPVLEEIRKKYPEVEQVREHEEGSGVFIASTKK